MQGRPSSGGQEMAASAMTAYYPMIYDFLVDAGEAFRSNVRPEHHKAYFDFQAMELFFGQEKR